MFCEQTNLRTGRRKVTKLSGWLMKRSETENIFMLECSAKQGRRQGILIGGKAGADPGFLYGGQGEGA